MFQQQSLWISTRSQSSWRELSWPSSSFQSSQAWHLLQQPKTLIAKGTTNKICWVIQQFGAGWDIHKFCIILVWRTPSRQLFSSFLTTLVAASVVVNVLRPVKDSQSRDEKGGTFLEGSNASVNKTRGHGEGRMFEVSKKGWTWESLKFMGEMTRGKKDCCEFGIPADTASMCYLEPAFDHLTATTSKKTLWKDLVNLGFMET